MAAKLIDYRSTTFSQNGEDGIIARVFEIIGSGEQFCCEFGAWDGVHLSNTRALILGGWSALMIEGHPRRFKDLQSTYGSTDRVVCECAYVDAERNSLASILERRGLAERRIDLLSIDVDGLDYNLFATLGQLRHRARLVVIEVQPEHGADKAALLPNRIAKHSIGQPLAAFTARGKMLGYRLICYSTCNAFFLAESEGHEKELPTLTAQEALSECLAICSASIKHAEYLFLRNLGLSGYPYSFNNPLLTSEGLGIPRARADELIRRATNVSTFRRVKRAVRRARDKVFIR